MIYAAAMSAFGVALVAIYMVSARFRRVVLSAARFFVSNAAPRARRWHFSRPVLSIPFWVQLAVLLLLLLADFRWPESSKASDAVRAGVWLIVDRSASMSTVQNGAPRMAAAMTALRDVVAQAGAGSGRGKPCFKLSSFDMEMEDWIPHTDDPATVLQTAAGWKPRPLGTDVGLVQQAVFGRARAAAEGCAITHIVVISDTPAPPWMANEAAQNAVWIDISQPAANIGVTAIAGDRNPLSGKVETVRFQVEAFGAMHEASKATIHGPAGDVKLERELHPDAEQIWMLEVKPEVPGAYRLDLSPGGAYRFDDHVQVEVPVSGAVRVDWQVGRRDLMQQLGWQQDAEHPQLRVIAGRSAGDLPTILVGDGFRSRPEVMPVWTFWEGSPLLGALNLDLAERLAMPAQRDLPDNFVPVLTGEGGSSWIAQRNTPPAAFIPGMPIAGDDPAARFSTVLFLNAARWILERREDAPLFRLTSPKELEPKGNLLALHPDEGNTGRAPVSYGTLDFHWGAGQGARRNVGVAPFLLLAAIVIFLGERWLSFFGGERWS